MREWALIVLIFIALMAGGYRMDEQFSPSLKAVSWSYVKLSKAERAVLFFRNKAFRHRFLRAALTGALPCAILALAADVSPQKSRAPRFRTLPRG